MTIGKIMAEVMRRKPSNKWCEFSRDGVGVRVRIEDINTVKEDDDNAI